MTETQRKWLRSFIDYAGPLAFLVVYFVTRDMMKATFAIVVGSALGLVLGLAVERRVAPLPLFVGGAALVFGGLTLLLHDPRIIKMKPTFINLAIGLTLLGGLALKKNPVKAVAGTALDLPDFVWRRLGLHFGLFYLALAVVNEVVWRTQPDAVWVLFRMPGLQILTFAFFFTQLPMILRHAKVEDIPPPPTE
jgi:intracellular septation protein